ncbi:hypothetical protein OG762_20000 [Streptomyces sp. NBC_01136]|uniref:hypothetical protein n=1 Tax=unclassified Streptomyces TaxID=2593676 RepID=UPI00324822FE|nr:hypothetical protein OG762_20000 [Streptomyces sp. NBC_01136]
MIVGVIVFAVVGIGLAVAQAIKRQWPQAFGALLVTVGVEMGYASMAFHRPWLSIVATVLLVAGAVLVRRLKRRELRRAERQQPS